MKYTNNVKFDLGFSDDAVWADGLLVFYEVFRFLEEAMVRNENTKISNLLPEGVERTKAFENDLEFYLGKDWIKTYTPR